MTRHFPQWWWLVPVILLATGLTALNLNGDPVYKGEFQSYRNIGLFDGGYSPLQIWYSVADTSPQHAPLYFILLRGWTLLVGTGALAARTLSFFIGVFTLVFIYRIGRDTVSYQVGLFAAAILSVSVYFIFYMHEIRMYSMMAALVAFVMWLYWYIVSREEQPRFVAWLGLYLGATLLIYTHYFGIFPLVALGIYHLIYIAKGKRWWLVVVTMALSGLTFLPWLPIVIAGFTTRSSLAATSLSTIDVLYTVDKIFGNGLAPLAAIVLISGVLYLPRVKQRNTAFVLVMFLATLLPILIANEISPVLPARRLRYSIVLWPTLALVAGLGISRFARWRLAIVALFAVWLAAGFSFASSDDLVFYTNRAQIAFDRYPPLHTITDEIKRIGLRASPNEWVITVKERLNLDDNILQYYSYALGRVTTNVTERHLDNADINESVLSFWLAYDPELPVWDYDVYREVITKNHQYCKTFVDRDDLRLEYYVLQSIPCEMVLNPDYEMAFDGDNIMVTAPLLANADDDALRLVTSWRVSEAAGDEPYSVSLQIFDADMNKVGQMDYRVPLDLLDVRMLDVADLPDGAYTVQMIVYNYLTGERVLGRHLSESVAHDMIPILQFDRS